MMTFAKQMKGAGLTDRLLVCLYSAAGQITFNETAPYENCRKTSSPVPTYCCICFDDSFQHIFMALIALETCFIFKTQNRM